MGNILERNYVIVSHNEDNVLSPVTNLMVGDNSKHPVNEQPTTKIQYQLTMNPENDFPVKK